MRTSAARSRAGVIGLALLSASCARSCCDDGERPRVSIAVCHFASGDVRFHPAREVVWESIEKGARFSAGDWVRTAEGAKAEIKFDSGGILMMDPVSMIVIEVPDDAASGDSPLIALESGVVRGSRSASDSKAITLETPDGKRLTLASKTAGAAFDYRVRVDETTGEVEVAVTKGEATLESEDGTTKELKAGQAGRVTSGAISERVFELPTFPPLLAPDVDARVRFEKGESVELSWQPVENATAYDVEIARDASFSNVRARAERREGGSWKYRPAGSETVFWRVRSRAEGGVGEFGFARRVHLEEFVPLRLLLEPAAGTKIQFDRKKPRVSFSWKPLNGAKEYTLVVAKDAALTQRVLTEKTGERSLETRRLGRGSYYWGVFADVDGAPVPIFENARPLKLTRGGLKLRAPKKLKWK